MGYETIDNFYIIRDGKEIYLTQDELSSAKSHCDIVYRSGEIEDYISGWLLNDDKLKGTETYKRMLKIYNSPEELNALGSELEDYLQSTEDFEYGVKEVLGLNNN